jgi:hypothetical protein
MEGLTNGLPIWRPTSAIAAGRPAAQAWLMRRLPLIACLLPALAGADGLPHGAYRVAVHIAVPNVETRDYDFETTVCWRGVDDPEMPLGPLGPGALAGCASHARDTPEGVAVTTTCPGPNAGFADASYRRTAEGFSGRIDINLGGKNMTLSELQRGTRTGGCN